MLVANIHDLEYWKLVSSATNNCQLLNNQS